MSEKIHPYCTVHYRTAFKIMALLEIAEKWCPEIQENFTEWAGESQDCSSESAYKEFKEDLETIKEEAETIQEELNWAKKNEQ
tara:strand:+ start:90 stop:338 length:249 start_codon:yes stop_codon:yes gene_type:complete